VPDLETDLIAGIDYLRQFPRSLTSFAVTVLVEIRVTNSQSCLMLRRTIFRCLKLWLELLISGRDYCLEMPESRQRSREAQVALVLEINSALWIMIGCLAIKAPDLIQYLG
jgi:hypothetical protein